MATSRLQRLQRLSWGVAVAGVVLGLAASGGCYAVPAGGPGWAWFLHPLVLVVGAAGGLAAVLRIREIDRRRWELVSDPTLTKGERELAHREAERERRFAGTAFLAGPFMFAYWMLYQASPGEVGVAQGLLPIVCVVGYGLGLLVGHLRWREQPPRF